MPVDSASLPFDIKFRYGFASALLEHRFSTGAGTPLVLDLGGPRGLAASFLPAARCISIDVKGSPDVLGRGTFLPFPDGCFNFTVVLDVLEHIEADEREAVVFEAARVTSRRLVIGGPFHHDRVIEAEKFISKYTGLLDNGIPDPNLVEHAALGLPVLPAVRRAMEKAAAGEVEIHEGIALNWWLILMVMTRRMTHFGDLAADFNSLIDVTRLRGRPAYNSFLAAPLDGTATTSKSEAAHPSGWEPGPVALRECGRGIEEIAALLSQESRIEELESLLENNQRHSEALAKERDALRESLHRKEKDLEEHIESLARHRRIIEDLTRFRERVLAIPGFETALRIFGGPGKEKTKK